VTELKLELRTLADMVGTWRLLVFETPRAASELLDHAQRKVVQRLNAAGRSTGQIDNAQLSTADRISKTLSSALTCGDERRGHPISANGCLA
jgi:hypothetical protein